MPRAGVCASVPMWDQLLPGHAAVRAPRVLTAGIATHISLSPFRCTDVCPLQRPDLPEVGRCAGVSVNPQ